MSPARKKTAKKDVRKKVASKKAVKKKAGLKKTVTKATFAKKVGTKKTVAKKAAGRKATSTRTAASQKARDKKNVVKKAGEKSPSKKVGITRRSKSPSLVSSGKLKLTPIPRNSEIEVEASLEGVRLPISLQTVRYIVDWVCRQHGVTRGAISVTFLDDKEMAKLNKKFLNHSGPTDVITFELKPIDGIIVGDIYIAPDVAQDNAAELGVRFRDEIVRLVVHGTLHVLGYVHPESEKRLNSPMWVNQEKLVATLIPALSGSR